MADGRHSPPCVRNTTGHTGLELPCKIRHFCIASPWCCDDLTCVLSSAALLSPLSQSRLTYLLRDRSSGKQLRGFVSANYLEVWFFFFFFAVYRSWHQPYLKNLVLLRHCMFEFHRASSSLHPRQLWLLTYWEPCNNQTINLLVSLLFYFVCFFWHTHCHDAFVSLGSTNKAPTLNFQLIDNRNSSYGHNSMLLVSLAKYHVQYCYYLEKHCT